MQMNVYSIYDKKTMMYQRPFYAHTSGHATRLVLDEMSHEDSQLSRYAGDFSLHMLGTWDDIKGELLGTAPKIVFELSQMKDHKK